MNDLEGLVVARYAVYDKLGTEEALLIGWLNRVPNSNAPWQAEPVGDYLTQSKRPTFTNTQSGRNWLQRQTEGESGAD